MFLDNHDGSITAMATVAIVALTCFYVSYSKSQWKTMEASNELTKSTLMLSNRSWIDVTPPKALSDMTLNENGGHPILKFRAPMGNPGHSPARSITAYTNVEIVSKDSAPSFNFLPTGSQDEISIIFPGTSEEHPHTVAITSFAPDETINVISDKQRLALDSGQSYLVLYGKIDYADDFGSHWTQFCWWKSFAAGDFTSRPCVIFNAVGDYAPATAP